MPPLMPTIVVQVKPVDAQFSFDLIVENDYGMDDYGTTQAGFTNVGDYLQIKCYPSTNDSTCTAIVTYNGVDYTKEISIWEGGSVSGWGTATCPLATFDLDELAGPSITAGLKLNKKDVTAMYLNGNEITTAYLGSTCLYGG